MRAGLVLLCVLCLYQSCTSQLLGRKCYLLGLWKNELGSNLSVTALKNGFFEGVYYTAVTSQENLVSKESPVSGWEQWNKDTLQPVFGFLVKWSFVESVTSFVGQCFMEKDGTERLETMWLMRGQAATAAEDWKQTWVGKNVFHRVTGGPSAKRTL
ncbi:avidin [Amia ocellicauda]|uniref:avidin n=1 Tax=Amia ocellicauda TaxID=2972642 RepID=UPI003464D907|nr:AVID protein [Amia calva]